MLHEIEQRLFGPVQVVEQADKRLSLRLMLEELPETPCDLVGGGGRLGLSEQRLERSRGVALGQCAELLQDLDDGPVGDPLAVGEAAATHDPRIEAPQELGCQARLPDAGRSENREELARAVFHRLLEGVTQSAQLRRAPDHLSCEAALDLAGDRQQRHAGTSSALPLSSRRRSSPTSTAARTRRSVLLPDQHLAGLRSLLQPGGDVDRIAGGEPLLGPGHDLAGVDADAAGDLRLGKRVAHLDGGATSAQRIVLVRDRNAKHGHHGVADELLHRTAVRLDDPLHPLEVAGEQRTQRFRVVEEPSAVEAVTSQKTTVTVFRCIGMRRG